MSKFRVVEWVIHSRSQGGWWKHDQGWVYCVKQATIFKGEHAPERFNLPTIGVNDCEWQPYRYDD